MQYFLSKITSNLVQAISGVVSTMTGVIALYMQYKAMQKKKGGKKR
jgi:hypothetical protein